MVKTFTAKRMRIGIVCDTCHEPRLRNEYRTKYKMPVSTCTRCTEFTLASEKLTRTSGRTPKQTNRTRTQNSVWWDVVTANVLGPYLKRAVACSTKNRAHLRNNDWLIPHSKQTHCPITRLAFDTTDCTSPLYPSLDRIDPRKGYTPANTRIVSLFVNVAKNRWSSGQFNAIITAIRVSKYD
jgi:hypothetical protein